jgi:hypothetical protein
MSIQVKQLSSYKHGMKHIVSIDSFRAEFERRLTKARTVHAKLAGARIAKAYRMEFGFAAVDIMLLADMAERYQVSQEYIPVAVAQAKKLLNA